MRNLLFILLFSISVFAQENKDSLYARGLKACLDKEVAEYSSISRHDLRDVIVEYDFDLTDRLPNQVGEIKVQYLSDWELAQKYNKLPKVERGRGIRFIKIFPLSDKDDRLVFAYNNYWFKYSEKGGFFSRKKFMFERSLEGGCHADIALDARQRKFVIEKVKLWGV